MKIRYDHEVDALYILFKDTTFTTKLLAKASSLRTTTRKGVWPGSRSSTL